jgi:hypothetical protein
MSTTPDKNQCDLLYYKHLSQCMDVTPNLRGRRQYDRFDQCQIIAQEIQKTCLQESIKDFHQINQQSTQAHNTSR